MQYGNSNILVYIYIIVLIKMTNPGAPRRLDSARGTAVYVILTNIT